MLLLALLWGCSASPPPPSLKAKADPGPAPTPAAHKVYLATHDALQLYQSVPEGLRLSGETPLDRDATVALGANRHGVFLWRDSSWHEFTPQLERRRELDLGPRFSWSEFQMTAFSQGYVADLGRKLTVFGPGLESKGTLRLPGAAGDILVHEDIAYILDAPGEQHHLIRVDLRNPDVPRLHRQVQFYTGPESRGEQWIDPEKRLWYVLMEEQLLVFSSQAPSPQGLAISCRQAFDIEAFEKGTEDGRFRVWKTTRTTPLWALGHDSQLALAQLEVTDQGLEVVRRLPLERSAYPLMSAPFVRRLGNRLYASDGGDLWVAEITQNGVELLQTLSFRYGLNLEPVPLDPSGG